VLGPGLPAEGKEIKIYPPETGAVATISDPPAGSQTWVVAAYWNTPEGRAIDILGSGLRVTETIPPPPPRPPPPKTGPPGPPPTGINVKAFPTSDPFRDLCDVSFVVTWAPVPGATGYTVYSDDGGSGLIPFTTFTFRSSIPWRNADLARGAVDANYRNKPEFTSTMNVKVASSFPDKPDGMSAAVPLTFSTYPCMNPRNPPK
jgi:hypothetical protein